MRILSGLCWATVLVVPGLLFGLAPVGARAVGDDDLAAVHAGAFTNCTEGASTDTACNSCPKTARQKCDSDTVSWDCVAYKDLYKCQQCEEGDQNCGGSLLTFGQDGCAGPSSNGGNCTRKWVQATSQNCPGTCPP